MKLTRADLLKLITEAVKDDGKKSIWVGLPFPKDAMPVWEAARSGAAVLTGVRTDDLDNDGHDPHVTLFWFKTADIEAAQKQIIAILDEMLSGPIEIQGEGVSSFPPSDSSDGNTPVILKLSSETLTGINKKITDSVVPENERGDLFDYNAHSTLGYFKGDLDADKAAKLPKWRGGRHKWQADTVELKVGDELVKSWSLKKPIQESLLEGISDLVWHETTLYNAIPILETNRFLTSVAFHTKSERTASPSNKFYYFSTKRSASQRFGGGGIPVQFKLNGRKLGHNFKAHPTDYWYVPGAHFPGETSTRSRNTAEAEDRIVTDKPYIENAADYILEVSILLEYGDEYLEVRENWIKEVEKLMSLAASRNIPAYLYGTIKDYRTSNKVKAITIEEWLAIYKKTKELKPSWPTSDYKSGEYLEKDLKKLTQIVQAVDAGKWDDVDTGYGSFFRQLSYHFQPGDFEPIIHNARKEPELRHYIVSITTFMKKHKIRDFPKLIHALADAIRKHKDELDRKDQERWDAEREKGAAAAEPSGEPQEVDV